MQYPSIFVQLFVTFIVILFESFHYEVELSLTIYTSWPEESSEALQ